MSQESERIADIVNNAFQKKANKNSNIKKVIAVVSGKGGVGKSLVTGLFATAAMKSGYNTAILDADVTGPSIPKMFGVSGQVLASEQGIAPAVSKDGIKMISTNLILEDPTDPVVWRGPVIAGVVEQFWTDVLWDDIDYMFIDMPPGTGDVPLTVFQSLPVDGIIIVTTPQDLVSMIVEKAVKMAEKMNIPVLGLVENMSYISCPDCNKKIEVFGKSNIDKIANKYNLPIIERLPIDNELTNLCDNGEITSYDAPFVDAFKNVLENISD